jgi:hypothetical protein
VIVKVSSAHRIAIHGAVVERGLRYARTHVVGEHTTHGCVEGHALGRKHREVSEHTRTRLFESEH